MSPTGPAAARSPLGRRAGYRQAGVGAVPVVRGG